MNLSKTPSLVIVKIIERLEKEILKDLNLQIGDNDVRVIIELLSGPGDLDLPERKVEYSFINTLKTPAGR
ncbi:MAG: hypothetical protein ACQEQG_04465 [Bacillota bacterium]